MNSSLIDVPIIIPSCVKIGRQEYNVEEDSPLIESERMELDRVKQEVEALRNELHRAEVELEDKCWMAPPVLQHWLQVFKTKRNIDAIGRTNFFIHF